MTNHLAAETSPYLLQHQDNPVDWYPWGEEASERARREDKPILLSVGYSACHWCHVMAHESFEDDETAALMNRLFVNVKVDREERPDVDAIYMEAVQRLTGRGGWPMTVFLTPTGEPFYAGTYFPKEDRPGMPSFERIMLAVADAWNNRRADVESQAQQLVETIDRTLPPTNDLPTRAALEQAVGVLAGLFDDTHGGFGGAPKFPQEPVLEFLLRVAGEPWAAGALDMARATLDGMAKGGIFDHVGGGFARYAVDRHWLIPHFEKMLYTNAQLARLYLRAWQLTGEERFRTVASSHPRVPGPGPPASGRWIRLRRGRRLRRYRREVLRVVGSRVPDHRRQGRGGPGRCLLRRDDRRQLRRGQSPLRGTFARRGCGRPGM